VCSVVSCSSASCRA